MLCAFILVRADPGRRLHHRCPAVLLQHRRAVQGLSRRGHRDRRTGRRVGQLPQCYGAAPPLTINTAAPKYLDLTLEEAVRLGLQNSQVIRRLGVSVLDSPARTPTRFDPAIQEMNPGPGVSDLRDIGVEAALAAFDAQLAGSVFAEKNDRAAEQRVLRRRHAAACSRT